MRILSLSFMLLLLNTGALAQMASTLVINATAETEIPADRISFRIHMNAEADNARKAFELHKAKENALVELLNEHDIAEKNIRFQPIAIHRQYYPNGDRQKQRIVTSQQVNLEMDDFTMYEEIQMSLIEHDFNEFNGQFLSSKIREGEDEALKKAISTARQKAELIAGETGSTIERIKKIEYSYNTEQPFVRSSALETRMDQGGGSLFEFGQVVRVSATVSVEYRVRN